MPEITLDTDKETVIDALEAAESVLAQFDNISVRLCVMKIKDALDILKGGA